MCCRASDWHLALLGLQCGHTVQCCTLQMCCAYFTGPYRSCCASMQRILSRGIWPFYLILLRWSNFNTNPKPVWIVVVVVVVASKVMGYSAVCVLFPMPCVFLSSAQQDVQRVKSSRPYTSVHILKITLALEAGHGFLLGISGTEIKWHHWLGIKKM